MLTPSQEIIQLLSVFAATMTAPTFKNALVLLYGAILAPGGRTVAACLRVMGLEAQSNPSKYHRVLSRARWSSWQMSRLLLGLLVSTFLPEGTALVLVVDETLERRAGKKIGYKGVFRDSVRSVGKKVAVSLGIRWCVTCLLVPLPWASRPWALPFVCVPVLSEKTCQRLKKPHRSGVWWTSFLIEKIRAWYPEREIVLVGDGGYASVELVACCQRLKVKLVARLRLDAQLYAFAGPQPKSKRGRKPKKGVRLRSLAARFADPETLWCQAQVGWYGGKVQTLGYRSGVCLWHTPGQNPVPIGWVLVRYEETNKRTGKVSVKAAALLCSDTTEACITSEQIIGWFVGRWNIEVTFEEIRAHLGLETQRHWNVRAISRTTPCLFGVFSLVVLMAQRLHPCSLPVRQAGWYSKEEATFSDVLAVVRGHLWSARNNAYSLENGQTCLIPVALWRQVQQVLAYAA
jgi:DDE superfamily endonuclease